MRSRFLSTVRHSIRRSLVMAAIVSITSVSAAAQNITYTFNGVGTGTLAGQSFTRAAFSFFVTAPIASVSTAVFGPGIPSINGVTMNFTIVGVGAGTFANAYVFNNWNAAIVGFGTTSRSDLLNLIDVPGIAAYDMVSDFGPANGTNLFTSQFRNQATSLGAFTMTRVSEISFGATTGDPSVVPEPSTYALLGVGMLGMGAIARRRRVKA